MWLRCLVMFSRFHQRARNFVSAAATIRWIWNRSFATIFSPYSMGSYGNVSESITIVFDPS